MVLVLAFHVAACRVLYTQNVEHVLHGCRTYRHVIQYLDFLRDVDGQVPHESAAVMFFWSKSVDAKDLVPSLMSFARGVQASDRRVVVGLEFLGAVVAQGSVAARHLLKFLKFVSLFVCLGVSIIQNKIKKFINFILFKYF